MPANGCAEPSKELNKIKEEAEPTGWHGVLSASGVLGAGGSSAVLGGVIGGAGTIAPGILLQELRAE